MRRRKCCCQPGETPICDHDPDEWEVDISGTVAACCDASSLDGNHYTLNGSINGVWIVPRSASSPSTFWNLTLPSSIQIARTTTAGCAGATDVSGVNLNVQKLSSPDRIGVGAPGQGSFDFTSAFRGSVLCADNLDTIDNNPDCTPLNFSVSVTTGGTATIAPHNPAP